MRPLTDSVLLISYPAAKRKKKFTKIDLSLNVQRDAMNSKQLMEAQEKEALMLQQDRIVQETQAKRNELESYVYDTRSSLYGLADYLTTQVTHSARCHCSAVPVTHTHMAWLLHRIATPCVHNLMPQRTGCMKTALMWPRRCTRPSWMSCALLLTLCAAARWSRRCVAPSPNQCSQMQKNSRRWWWWECCNRVAPDLLTICCDCNTAQDYCQQHQRAVCSLD